MKYISQFPLQSIEAAPQEIIFHLTERHTDCLAPEKCIPPPPINIRTLKFNATK